MQPIRGFQLIEYFTVKTKKEKRKVDEKEKKIKIKTRKDKGIIPKKKGRKNEIDKQIEKINK